MKTKGFTLTEMMIVMVIIGLLAAMAIPAVQKIRYSTLKKKIERGERLTTEEIERYKRYRGNTEQNKKFETKENHKEIMIDGKIYYLVPKD